MSDLKIAAWKQFDEEYRAFQDREAVPVHTGLAVDDVRALELADNDRTGGRSAFVNLDGMEGMCDVQLHEIPPGGELEPQRHLHDALVFVVAGRGLATVGEGSDQQRFEFGPNAAFYLPHNTRYALSNGDGERPARLLFETPLPLYYSLLKSDAPIWESRGHSGLDEFDDEDADNDLYAVSGELEEGKHDCWYWESNFIPDAATFDLKPQGYRGAGNTNARIPFRRSPMRSHISEFPPGRYKKAHRHLCGANVLPLSGEGYTLMWLEGAEERTRVDWGPYSLFTPPTLWYHQHFNTSAERARYIVLHSPVRGTGMQASDNPAVTPRRAQNQIEYEDEDPEIRETFQRELDDRGIENRMEPSVYAASGADD